MNAAQESDSLEKSNGSRSNLCENRHASLASSAYAPWYNVSKKPVVSVEHPFIIRNVDKALEMLGGPIKLQELVQESSDSTANLYLHPGDRMFKPLKSANVKTNDILLIVTLPKRTGLKRKRVSQGPFHDGREAEGRPASERLPLSRSMVRDAQYLMRSLRGCPKDYKIQPVGTMSHTHRFRGMPDFVYSTANSTFMRQMREHILPFEYEKMKGFTFDMSKGVKPNTEIIPPPSFSHLTYPFNYTYRQNPSVKHVVDELGNATTVNVNSALKIWNKSVPFNIETVPTAPSPDTPPEETLVPGMQRLIAAARKLMEDRPVFTRRALINSLPGDDWNTVGENTAKHIFQYVGYIWGSGPWRDGWVRYGVDPRKDPGCRQYQTMMFMLEKDPKDNRAKFIRLKPERTISPQIARKESHLFDGQNVSKDGKVWQVCDITDPFLKELLATDNIRKECHTESDGWYHNGTWAKAKIVMKHKIAAILEGMPQNTAAYEKVVKEMPDIITMDDRAVARLGKGATSEEIALASQIRATSFVYRMPSSVAAPTRHGGMDEEAEQDGEMVMPRDDAEDLVDPRLMEIESEFDRLEGGGGTGEIKKVDDRE